MKKRLLSAFSAVLFTAETFAGNAGSDAPIRFDVPSKVASDVYPAPGSKNTPPAGFTALFNGQDLSGWWGAGNDVNPLKYLSLSPEDLAKKREASIPEIEKHWKVANGELLNDGRGLFLTTEKYYGDFELLVDYKTVPRADSGIYLRGTPQVQIWDYTEKGKFQIGSNKGSGGLWNNSKGAPGKDPLVLADRPFGEWNRLRIVIVGSRVWTWLNGQPTVVGAIMENYFDRSSPLPPRGPILLQTHGREIIWRNIFVREIGVAEGNAILHERGNEAGFKSIFNSKDLTGWTGAKEAVHIEDGAIVWNAKKGGTLYTEEKFSDYVVRFEFKLPRGGNNGLAIRYPGQGDPAYVGMTELQILDDNYEANTKQKIDLRQAHGSAYGMVAAKRGYQRPLGEWNYQEVTVKGSTLRVELNGVPILNTDLSKVTKYAGNRQHPGKDRTTGYFGFAGHNDPVQFRNIEIKPLTTAKE